MKKLGRLKIIQFGLSLWYLFSAAFSAVLTKGYQKENYRGYERSMAAIQSEICEIPKDEFTSVEQYKQECVDNYLIIEK